MAYTHVDGSYNNRVMGELRCMIERHGIRNFLSYKRRFWVVNESEKCLEMYKNDQAHCAEEVIRAEDIRGVLYAGDKQNRFFVMVLETRRSYTVRFRMSSQEERERWSAAITQLIATDSTFQQRRAVLQLVQRRTAAASRSLGMDIYVETAQLLSEVSEDLLQYVVEAVEVALEHISILLSRSGTMPAPRRVLLAFETSSADPHGPLYDPSTQALILFIFLRRNDASHAQLVVNTAEEVLLLMQSNTFRDPYIEGWLMSEPSCVAVRDELRALLQLHVREEERSISFLWCSNLNEHLDVEGYLERHVGSDLMHSITCSLEEALQQTERILGHTATPSTSAAHSVVGPLMSGMLPPPPPPLYSAEQSTRAAASLFTPTPLRRSEPRPTPQLFSPSQPVGHNASSHSPGARGAAGHVCVPSSTSPARLLAEHITGFCIVIDRESVAADRPPLLDLFTHPTHLEQRCRPAFLLAAQLLKVFYPTQRALDLLLDSTQPLRPRVNPHLTQRLMHVSFIAALHNSLQQLHVRLSAIVGRTMRVVIVWESLFKAIHTLGLSLRPEELFDLIHTVGALYTTRMHLLFRGAGGVVAAAVAVANPSVVASGGLMRQPSLALAAPGGAGADDSVPAGGVGADADGGTALSDTLRYCINCIAMEFSAYGDGSSVVPLAHIPEPTVAKGVLTDVFFCTVDANIALVHEAIQRQTNSVSGAAAGGNGGVGTSGGGGGSSTSMLTRCLLHHLWACPATPRLGRWCEHYFSYPEHVNRCPQRRRRRDGDGLDDDDDEDDDGGGSAHGSLDINFGEAVALERSEEIQVLNLHRVVTTVYDSQGSHLELKISADAILGAIESLSDAFGRRRRVSKHDLTRVLILNLRRLRHMYSHAMDGPSFGSLTRAEAVELLHAFCEYKETEREVEPLLNQLDAMDGGGEVEDGRQRPCHDEFSVSVRSYSFSNMCWVALNHLLPLEAMAAQRAWRTGFVFGLTNTGKTLLTNCLRGLVRPPVATVGLSQKVVAFEQWVLGLYELGGRDTFRTNWRHYVRSVERIHFLFFVVDSQNYKELPEASAYLHAVADFFPTLPLVVVFNHHQELPRPVRRSDLEGSIRLDKVRKRNPKREVMVATCNVIAPHESNRTIPPEVQRSLEQLAFVLRANSSTDNTPFIPKADGL